MANLVGELKAFFTRRNAWRLGHFKWITLYKWEDPREKKIKNCNTVKNLKILKKLMPIEIEPSTQGLSDICYLQPLFVTLQNFFIK